MEVYTKIYMYVTLIYWDKMAHTFLFEARMAEHN